MIRRSTTSDTSRHALDIHIDSLRSLGAEGRLALALALALALELSQNVRELSLKGLKLRHPELDDEAATLELLRMTVEPAAFARFLESVSAHE